MVAETNLGTDRWAQLTYASFDDGTGPGGWQVKETVGALTAAELDALRSRVVTAFGAVDPLPQFPTPTQIDGLARRFTYAPTGVGASWAYWHAAQAGSDGTGRPGNVFSHVVLDRLPTSAAATLRPVLAWRSNWLAPFGQQQVLTSTVGGNPVLGVGPVGPDAVVAFLTDASSWRIGVLAVLLDAVRDAMSGGRPVVLATDVPETAALWAASVSLFMSAGTSRRFALSLFERATELDEAIRHGVHLVAIPSADVASVGERDDIVLIDDQSEPSLGDPGGSPHRLDDGTTVPASNWSVLAQVALADPSLANATLDALDAVADAVGDVGLVPEWPLAMVVVAHGGILGDGELLDARDEAAQVLAENSPVRLRDQPALWAATAEALGARFGSSTEEALALAEAGVEGSHVLSGLAARAYAERAIGDRAWLARTGPVPVPAGARGVADAGLRRRAETALGEWLERVGQNPPAAGASLVSAAVEILHLLDLMDSVGLPLVDPDALSPAERLVEMLVAPVLVSGEGHGLVERTGPVGPGVRALARDVTASMPEVQHRSVGNVLISPVLAWLYSDDDPIVPRADGLLTPLDRERVIVACRTGGGSVVAGLRHLAFVDVARAARALPTTTLDRRLVMAQGALLGGVPWTPAQVLEAWQFQVDVPDHSVARVLRAARDGKDLDELVALPLPEQMLEAAPLGRMRSATQQLFRISREPVVADTLKDQPSATWWVDEVISALAASGSSADGLDTFPEIVEPIVAAVAIRAVSSVLPVGGVPFIVAEKLAGSATAVGVRAVLDAVVAEGGVPGADTRLVAELFVRAESDALGVSIQGGRSPDVSRLRLGGDTAAGGPSIARVLAESVFDARPSAVPGAMELAARLVDQSAISEPDPARAHDGADVVRRLFARWLDTEQPTKTRSGLLGRFGRNEVN